MNAIPYRRTAAGSSAGPRSRPARLFPLGLPTPLTLVTPERDDLTHDSAQRAATVKDFLVQVELQQSVPRGNQTGLISMLDGYLPSVNELDGRTHVQLTASGHDIWEAILVAMTALTNAGCSPCTIQITAPDESEGQPS